MCEKSPSLLYLLAFFPDTLRSWPQVCLSLRSTCKVSHVQSVGVNVSEHKGKGNCHKSQIFVCGELWNFLKEIVALKIAENFCQKKFNGPRLGRYPRRRYSFTLAIWVLAPKSTVFQSNLYCKTIIRFSPSFRKNIQHFHLISLMDLTLHTETNDDHWKLKEKHPR